MSFDIPHLDEAELVQKKAERGNSLKMLFHRQRMGKKDNLLVAEKSRHKKWADAHHNAKWPFIFAALIQLAFSIPRNALSAPLFGGQQLVANVSVPSSILFILLLVVDLIGKEPWKAGADR